MNILNKKFINYKNSKIKYEMTKKGLIAENTSSKYEFLLFATIRRAKTTSFEIEFYGKPLDGLSANFCIFDMKKNLIGELSMNSKNSIDTYLNHKYVFALKIFPHTKVLINKILLENEKTDQDKFVLDYLDNDNDILVITPSYPTFENRYLCGFVHTRLKAYKESGLKFDVICCHNYNGVCRYTYEGIDVLRIHFNKLRNILQQKKYSKILVHFFDSNYSKIFDACYLEDTELFLWVHGPETLYWDWPKFTTGYFTKEKPISFYDQDIFSKNDNIIKYYNEKKNVTWIFVSNWIKKQSEKLINIKFNNYMIIPNYINSDEFTYRRKEPELRKKIFFIRRFDNCNKYAIDMNIRTILELSNKKYFNDLEFNIYGTGDFYDQLVEPIKDFKNVHLYRKFLSHDEISKIHKQNGIGFFPTRYDAQGVSMCEAAMSGLAIVTSNNDAVKEFLPNDIKYCSTENYKEYADLIEKLYYDIDEFEKYSKNCYKSVLNKCNFDETIGKEIELFKIKSKKIQSKDIKKTATPILSITIPCYNVSLYVRKTISSILNCKNASKIELIIVNDGSKDNTVEVVNEMIKKYSFSKKESVIKFINKENGGHGSTINEGLKVATGKYFRVIDGDDWVNTENLDKLLELLDKTDADIVVTNYSEDVSVLNTLISKNIYEFMTPGLIYDFDSLCYDNYGFGEWGPILATGNYKTDMLKKTNFKLTEKSFYVDMEYNIYSIENANSIVYYPLDIYRYFIGRIGQSVSMNSFIKNREQHQKVLFNMIEYVSNNKNISPMKRNYIYKKLIYPMANAHYIIVSEYTRNRKIFMSFDKKLSKYADVYNCDIISRKYIKLNRKTKGWLLPFSKILIKINSIIRRR